MDPIALIMLLAREFRLMFSVSSLMRLGIRKKEVAKKLGLQDWQVDKIERENTKFYEDDLVSFLKELSFVDYKIKSGEGDKYLELKTFLLKVF